VEIKPLELLRELLLRAGHVRSKKDLLNAIWPDLMVVEASLTTAVRKLRLALNDNQRPTSIIETVPRIGYRFAVAVEVEEATGPANGQISADPLAAAHDDPEAVTAATDKRNRAGARVLVLVSVALALGIGAAAISLISSQNVPAPKAAPMISQRDAANALRRLDVDTIEQMLAAGWDPNRQIATQGNAALHYVMEMCEWNRGHDQNRLLLMVRTIYEGGGRLDQRNIWGDTPYSIAKAPRYCGPDHPVTRSIRATCSEHGIVLDRCLASYELARRRRG
jgi:DNA-binding winged helix-turn-helix (wHTH) protein